MSNQPSVYVSPLRYPGGKGQLANFVKLILRANGLLDGEYAEVYAGGAGVALSLLLEEYVSHVHINDLDRSVYAFWSAALNSTDDLCKLINDTPVTVEQWKVQREVHRDAANQDELALAFSTFFLNRTNRSGILKAGVIGGQAQDGNWKLDVRYNKPELVQRIRRIAKYRERITIYRQDATDFIRKTLPTLPKETFVYFDPPYFNKGKDLYVNHYSPTDHEGIAKLITKDVKQPWLVTYDMTPEIEKIYSTQAALRYRIVYTAQVKYAGAEIMYHSKGLVIPPGYEPTKVSNRDLKNLQKNDGRAFSY